MRILINKQNNDKLKKVFASIGNYTTFNSVDKRTVFKGCYPLLYIIVITILTVYCESLLSLWLSMFCCGAVMMGPFVGLEL